MRHVMDLSREMHAQGHEVDIAYSSLRFEPAFKDRFLALKDEGIGMYEIPMRQEPHPSDRFCVRELRAKIKAQRYDVVQGHSTKSGLVARLAAKKLGCKVFFTPHGLYTQTPGTSKKKALVYGVLERYLARFTDKIILLSESELAHARELGLPASKLVRGTNGIAEPAWESRDACRARYRLGADDYVIGWIGRFAFPKSPETAIRTMALVIQQLPNAKLLMAGEGVDLEACKALACDLGVKENVVFTGPVKVAEFFPACDVEFLSSLSEALPYALLEALFAGLPIVATRVGGTKETITQATNGYVGDTEQELADALVKLGKDATLRESMGAASHARSSDFTIKSMVDWHLNLYVS